MYSEETADVRLAFRILAGLVTTSEFADIRNYHHEPSERDMKEWAVSTLVDAWPFGRHDD